MQTITTQSISINPNRYKMADISLYAEDIVMCTVCCSKCSRHGTTSRRRVSTVKQTPPVYDTKLQFWQFNLFSGHGYTFEGPRKLPNLRYLGWRVTYCFTSKGVGYFFLYYVSIPICCNSFCLLLEVYPISSTGDSYAWFHLLISRVLGYGRSLRPF